MDIIDKHLEGKHIERLELIRAIDSYAHQLCLPDIDSDQVAVIQRVIGNFSSLLTVSSSESWLKIETIIDKIDVLPSPSNSLRLMLSEGDIECSSSQL